MTTTDFDLTRNGIIRNAYQMAGIVSPGSDPDTEQLAFGSDMLNVTQKALQNEGIILRTLAQTTFPLVAGQATYVMPANTLDIDPGTPYVSNTGTGSNLTNVPLAWYSRAMYMALTVPTTTGQPTSIYVEKTPVITVYLYPVPDSNWASMTLPLISMTNDYDVGGSTSGLQAKYLRTLIFGLATDLALSFGLFPRYSALSKEFEMAKTLATNDDGEHGSIRFVADYSMSSGSGWRRGI
jgi:hypothetical protein